MFSRARTFAFLGFGLAALACVLPWCVSRSLPAHPAPPAPSSWFKSGADSRSPPHRLRYRGCNPSLPSYEKPCQTVGLTGWTSDWSSARLLSLLLPAFVFGACAFLLTAQRNALIRRDGVPVEVAPKTLAALGRLAGGAAAVGGAWGVYGVYASSMPMAQLDVHARITLRTQHVGWYLALLADAFASLGGVVAILFGRGAILGPSQAQLRGREADERLLRVITHRPAPYQVGLTPRGERVMRTPRPAGAGETSRAHSGAFTRRDNFEEYEGGPATFRWGGKTANANANTARGRATRGAVGIGAGGRARAREAPVAIVEAGQSGWEAFKANFWSARGGEPSGVSGAAGTTASAAAKYAVGGAEAKGEEDRDGSASASASASAYRVERDRRVGRLTGLLTGSFGRGGAAKPPTAPGTASNKPAGTTTAGTNTPGNKPVFAFRFPAAEPTPTAPPAPSPLGRRRPPPTPVPAYELSSSSSEDEHEDPASPPLLSPSKRQTRRERAAASRATAAPVPELSLRQRAELGRL